MHRSPTLRRLVLCVAVLVPITASSTQRAAAYTIETQVTSGCHEGITGEALREVRRMDLAPPLSSTERDDGPLLDDLPFSLGNDERDIGAASMILGVRDNDIKDLSPEALDELGQLTAEPALQREHCLRSDTEREPDGTARAVADCRGFIKQRLMDSLDGLGADGAPDGQLRQPLTVTLALRGRYTVSVPMFYVRFGQAAHAIQDSFTHTFRDPLDPHKITVTLDWIDYASNKLDEAADGPPHMSELDRCAPQGPAAALSGTSRAATPGLRDPAGSVFLHAAAAASYDNPALAFALGGKYQLSTGWMVGLDAEWNPWLPKTPFRFRAGTGNAYATLVRRYQFGYEPVNFRTTAALGASTLLIDLPGAQKWGLGPFAGISFLGVEWKIHPGYYLVVDPTYITVVAPHLTGTPLVYYQYRFQVGIEIGG